MYSSSVRTLPQIKENVNDNPPMYIHDTLGYLASGTISTLDMAEVDRELTPIIAEMLRLETDKDMLHLGTGNNLHPVVSQLSKWLQNPHRTGKEFTSIIEDLACKVMGKRYSSIWIYLVKVAAEFLVAKCPKLEGSWEEAAWLLLYISQGYVGEKYGFDCHKLSLWIIHVISDPNICPNPCLRNEIINIVLNMVKIKACSRRQRMESG